MNAEKMASLFDVNLETSLEADEVTDIYSDDIYSTTDAEAEAKIKAKAEAKIKAEAKVEAEAEADEITDTYSTKATATEATGSRSFGQRCDDVKAMMKTESEPDIDRQIINDAINKTSSVPKSVPENDPDPDPEIPDHVKFDVDDDIAAFEREVESGSSEEVGTPEEKVQPKTKPETVQKLESEPEPEPELELDSVSSPDDENPLDLQGEDLKAYQTIKEHFPQFCVYDGNRAFRDFYRHKVLMLRTLLGRFSLLDLREMSEEVKEVKLDHYIKGDIITPDLVQVKLNDAYRARVRLASLLIDAFEQHSCWRRSLALANAKLWKDHELKGIHRREGLTMEHLFDVEQYVEDTQGFIDSAKHADGMLKAASESLSRQLTCLQIKEQHGLSYDKEHAARAFIPEERVDLPESNRAERLDSISEGTVISAPEFSGEPQAANFGATQEDEISKLG